MLNTLEHLQKIVGEQLVINPKTVDPTADFIKELGADSLDIIELIMTIEYEFEIDIEDRYASRISTVQDIINYIDKKDI